MRTKLLSRRVGKHYAGVGQVYKSGRHMRVHICNLLAKRVLARSQVAIV